VTRSKFSRIATVSLLAVVLVLGAAQYAFAEKTIALGTGTFEVALAAGDTASDTIVVSNDGDEPFKALVYASDIVYDDKGASSYVRPTGQPGDFLKSPASWLTLRMPTDTAVLANTPYIELEPGQQMTIDFELAVPMNAVPGDHSAVVFFEVFDTEPTTGAASKISGRLGCRINVRVAGEVVERMDVAPFAVRGFVIGDRVPYSFTVSNQGNVDKRYVPSLVVLDSSEAETQRTQIEEQAVAYAQNVREHVGTLVLDRQLFGRYTVRAEVVYDREGGSTSERLVKDRTVWVFPLWFAILVVLAIGLPVLWLVWRSSVNSAEKRRTAARSARRTHTEAVGGGTALEEDVEEDPILDAE
jgi:hypothetical protein